MSGHKGLYDKYEVRRKETGEVVDGAFILRPVTDEAARIAIGTYAYATHNPRLRLDIMHWLADIRNEQAFDEAQKVMQVDPDLDWLNPDDPIPPELLEELHKARTFGDAIAVHNAIVAATKGKL